MTTVEFEKDFLKKGKMAVRSSVKSLESSLKFVAIIKVSDKEYLA